MVVKNPLKIPKYFCENCEYQTGNKKDFTKHLSTAKHKKIVNDSKKRPKNATPFACICGKTYKYDTGYYRHIKKCPIINKEEEKEEEHDDPNDPSYKALFMEAMKTMQLQQKQMLDMVPLIGSNNNNTTNNNNFNLQLFLNDTCKDALNITDFLNSLQVQLKDLEYTTDNGHINGITNIFHTALCNMEENKRPMHCTDLKRKVLYIKENDEWKRDEDKEQIKSAVTKVVDKNIENQMEWMDNHPEILTSGSRDSNRYIKMMSESLGEGTDTEQNKIIKNILKEVIIDK